MKPKEWAYLLTGLGLFHKTKVAYPDVEEVILEDIDVKLRRISMIKGVRVPRLKSGLHYQAGDDRFVFYANEGERDDDFAQRFADAVTGSLALASDVATEEAFTAICIGEDTIKQGRFIRIKDIVGDIGSELYFRVMQSTGVSSETLDYVWHIVPTIAKNESLMDASHFYRESITQAWVADDDVFEIMSNNSDTPSSQAERACIETAYQNAFKAIEAVIGEPPKEEGKLRMKLIETGINPDEKVGYNLYGMKPGKETLLKKVMDMHQNRDKKAAHGKTNIPRTIGYCELKDKQALARYLIASHIETKLKVS